MFFLKGLLPIPSDALVGLYHPWRDANSSNYPNGIPYKNPLITDPIRQQYPYRSLTIESLKKGILPKWNPYSFSGTPLFANIQSGALYPLNILFWILPFSQAWSVLVYVQPLLAGLFTYFYLRNINMSERASFLGGLAFAFSGFMVSWMEWNTLGHTALWLPLILLAKDKLIIKKTWAWAITLIFAESSMLLAGHLQTALYVVVFSSLYLWVKIWIHAKTHQKTIWQNRIFFTFTGSIVLLITSVQWWPALKFILLSAREFDLANWNRSDWFIPWRHLVQFIAPDFYGNPATGNYVGVWNYGEFIGYIALFPLLMAVFALIARRDKKTLFFGGGLLGAIIMATPNGLSRLPYLLNLPLISTMQPSRIMVIIDFCLAVLAAFGLDYIVKPEKLREKRIVRMLMFGLLTIVVIWGFVLLSIRWGIAKEVLNSAIAGRNLILPTGFFFISMFGIFGLSRFALKNRLMTRICIIILLSMTIFDLYRFFAKFTPFTSFSLLYQKTQTIEFLQENLGHYRLMTTDRRLIPPNVSAYYNLATVDGYDPLYLKNYAELMAFWTRNEPDISPASFNRIVTPENPDSFMTDLLGVKYVLSLTELNSPKLKLALVEGQTRVYENTSVYPRVFLAENVKVRNSRQEIAEAMFSNQRDLSKTAFIQNQIEVGNGVIGIHEMAVITKYEPNLIQIAVETDKPRLLVLTDIYYPEWKVFVTGVESKIVEVDLALRGVEVPSGESLVEFRI